MGEAARPRGTDACDGPNTMPTRCPAGPATGRSAHVRNDRGECCRPNSQMPGTSCHHERHKGKCSDQTSAFAMIQIATCLFSPAIGARPGRSARLDAMRAPNQCCWSCRYDIASLGIMQDGGGWSCNPGGSGPNPQRESANKENKANDVRSADQECACR
jgi:hypothetical protein